MTNLDISNTVQFFVFDLGIKYSEVPMSAKGPTGEQFVVLGEVRLQLEMAGTIKRNA